MESKEIKSIKKRCEALVREIYLTGKDYCKKRNLSSSYNPAKATTFYTREEDIPSIGVKEKKGGFFISLGGLYMGDAVSCISYLSEDGSPLTLETKNPALVLEALDRLEADPHEVVHRLVEKQIEEREAWAAKRMAEKAARDQVFIEQQRQIAVDCADELAQIWASVEKIERLVNVKETLMDANRKKSIDAKKRLLILPANERVLVLDERRLIFCNQVKNNFGLSFVGTHVIIRRDENFLNKGTAESIKELLAFIKEAEKDPLGLASKAGICFFCAADLTDEESRRRGYGPTCATKHRMPWGKEVA